MVSIPLPVVVDPDSAGPRYGKTHTSHARASAVPAFIYFDVALVTYVMPRFSQLYRSDSQIGVFEEIIYYERLWQISCKRYIR